VFTTSLESPLDAANVRRAFRRVAAAAGLDAAAWTPRELRHSFVSLLSSTGQSIEDISHLVGHANTHVTESVYRKELRPVLTRGAGAMDALFADPTAKYLVSRLVSMAPTLTYQSWVTRLQFQPDKGRYWWAILGSNQWPLPCQYSRPRRLAGSELYARIATGRHGPARIDSVGSQIGSQLSSRWML
jgi:Phage integrase family